MHMLTSPSLLCTRQTHRHRDIELIHSLIKSFHSLIKSIHSLIKSFHSLIKSIHSLITSLLLRRKTNAKHRKRHDRRLLRYVHASLTRNSGHARRSAPQTKFNAAAQSLFVFRVCCTRFCQKKSARKGSQTKGQPVAQVSAHACHRQCIVC